jgi:hypothetical protein
MNAFETSRHSFHDISNIEVSAKHTVVQTYILGVARTHMYKTSFATLERGLNRFPAAVASRSQQVL